MFEGFSLWPLKKGLFKVQKLAVFAWKVGGARAFVSFFRLPPDPYCPPH